MAAYLIIEGKVTDKERWKAYSEAVVPLIARFGGRHLNASGSVTKLEGTHDDWIVALFGFETMAEIERFWSSPDYVPVKALRQGAADLEIKAVAGTDEKRSDA